MKTQEHASKPRYKARLVVKAFEQKKGTDFDENFSPVVEMYVIQIVLGLTSSTA